MKKFLYLLLLPVLMVACKNTNTKCDNCETYTGEFLYLEDAAILKGTDFIYSVEVNQQAKEIADKIASIKNDEFDMVEITVKGIVNPKPENEEGWDEILTIKEIITIADEPTAADILIQQ